MGSVRFSLTWLDALHAGKFEESKTYHMKHIALNRKTRSLLLDWRHRTGRNVSARPGDARQVAPGEREQGPKDDDRCRTGS